MEKQPKKITIQVVERILDSECSLGEKFLLVEVLGNAASALANEKDIESLVQHRYRICIQEENEFFGTESLFETPMVILGTLKKKMSHSKVEKG